jgi:DNA-directed RNA polymerase alpha subunit
MAELPGEPTRQAAAYGQLQERFLGLSTALHDQIRAFNDATGQILTILTEQTEALAKLAKAAELTGTPIEELMLEGREYGLLTRAGVHTVEELTDMTETDLYDLRNAGVKSVAKIKARLLDEFGLTLKEAADA